MNSRWIEAAEKYRLARKPAVEQIPLVATVNTESDLPERIRYVADKLDRFLKAEIGAQAMALLKESQRHIIFGESREGGGFADVYYIDGEGIHSSHEAYGTWVAYGKAPQPIIKPATTYSAVHAAVYYGHRKPEELFHWLYAQLDQIAYSAPGE